ncbi:hypothetical protein [Facilibium subflavum]|uniref:hypothetical protein n=1 Tax=Facilibium subflavum TaxID=2219058 RepID=UPI000E64C5ED|nr:hypothetical protein [Facilibium subflavum]
MQLTSFPFGKEVRAYKQSEVVTPFQKQGQLYDKPIGQHLHRAYIWRVAFFASSGISLLFSLVLVSIFNANPYTIIVEQVTNKGFLKSPPAILRQDYSITPAVLSGFLKSILLNMDKVDQYTDFLSSEAKSELQKMQSNFSKQQWQRMRFTDFNISGMAFTGKLVDQNNHDILNVKGSFSQTNLDGHKEVKINPLGIYINTISIQRLS